MKERKTKHRFMKLFCFFVASSMIISGCQASCDQGAVNTADSIKSPGEENAVALVNDIPLNKEELDTLHGRAVNRLQMTGRNISQDLDRKIRGSILRKMIDDEIIKQKISSEGINIDRFERVEALEKYKERMGGQKSFELFLKHQNLSEEQMLKTILAEKQRDKLVEKLTSWQEPTETEIKAYYMANKRLFTLPEMVRAKHILLKLSPDAPKEKEEVVLNKANRIIEEALSKESSFKDLVHKYSEGPSVKTDGDLGFFPRGRMVKEFEQAAFNAPLKKPVGPIRTHSGYHIILVEEKSPPKIAALDEVRDRVVEFLTRNKRGRKTEDLLKSLRKKANIKIKDYSLTKEEYDELSKLDEKGLD